MRADAERGYSEEPDEGAARIALPDGLVPVWEAFWTFLHPARRHYSREISVRGPKGQPVRMSIRLPERLSHGDIRAEAARGGFTGPAERLFHRMTNCLDETVCKHLTADAERAARG